MAPWQYERVGEVHFRWRLCAPGSRFAFTAEAKRSPFVTGDGQNCIDEPMSEDLWFEYGATAEEAVGKLKREVLD